MLAFFSHISLKEKIFFTRHLAILTKAGIPLLESLVLIKKQIKGKLFAIVIMEIIQAISNGQSLSKPLEKYKQLFGTFFISIIKIGESSGTLFENLNYLTNALTQRRELQSKITGALLYPAVLVLSTFGIIGFLATVIFPKLLPIFIGLNVKLPFTTVLLLQSSLLLKKYGIFLVIGSFFILGIGFFLLRIPSVRFSAYRIFMKLPLLGSLLKTTTIVQFTRTLGMLLKSGAPIVKGVQITTETISNPVYQKEFSVLLSAIQQGRSLSSSFKQKEDLFPPASFTSVVAVGETTGHLDESLFIISDFYESELSTMTRNLSVLLEPFLMVMLGVIIGFVAFSIIVPIYQISQNLQR